MNREKAKIADLKNNLSAYLREVRKGSEVVVVDRDRPIAKIIPFARRDDEFVVIEPRGKPTDLLKIKPVKTKKKIDWQKILHWTRADRKFL